MDRPTFATDDMIDFLNERAKRFRMEMWDDIMLQEEFPGLTLEQAQDVVDWWKEERGE